MYSIHHLPPEENNPWRACANIFITMALGLLLWLNISKDTPTLFEAVKSGIFFFDHRSFSIKASFIATVIPPSIIN
jgi:hypothetical protein